MDHTLRVGRDGVKRFIEWSLFVEEGDVDTSADGTRGVSTVEQCEIDLSNNLMELYRQMKKAKSHGTELFHELTINDVEVLRSWYYRIPENLLGENDANTYTQLSIFQEEKEDR